MAKAELTVKTDLTPLTTAFIEQDKIVQQTNKDVIEFGEESKKAYVKAWVEANKYNKELIQGNKELKNMDNATKSILTGAERLKELRKEMKNLTGEAIRLRQQGDLVGADKAIKKVGELKDELKDIQEAINSVAGNARENLAKGFGKATQVMAQGFEGVVAVQSLVGEENEDIHKQLLKLQAIQSISRIAAEFGDIGDRMKEIKLAFSPLTNLYVKGNDALKAYFKNNREGLTVVGGETKSLSAKIYGLGQAGVNSFKTLWTTIKANPLGIILTVIGVLITAMVTLRDKVKPIAALFDFLGEVMEKAIAPLRRFGELMGWIADQNEKRHQSIVKSTEKELDLLREYYDQQIKLAEATERKTNQLEYAKGLALSDRVAKSIKSLNELQKINGKLNKEQLEEYQKLTHELNELDDERNVHLAKRQTEVKNFFKEQSKSIRDAQILSIKDEQQREEAALKAKFEDAKDNAGKIAEATFDREITQALEEEKMVKVLEEQFQRELQTIRDKWDKKRLEKQKELNDKLKALQKDFLDSLMDLTRRVETAELNNLVDEERIKKQIEISIRELDLLRQTLVKKGQAEENFAAKMQNKKAEQFQLSTQQQEQFNILEQEIYKNATNELVKIQAERQQLIEEAKAKGRAQSLEALEAEQEGQITGIQSLSSPGSSKLQEVEFEEAKQRKILEIQRKFAEDKLALQKKNLSEQTTLTEKQAQIENQIINTEYQKTINDITEKLKDLNKAKPFSMAKLFGLTDEEFSQLQSAISGLISEVQNLSNAFFDAKKQLIADDLAETEKIIEEREKNISDLESKIEQEKQLRLLGKANNVSAVNAQLAEEKRLRDEALKEKKIQRLEEARLAREQLVTDTILQASNLASAASNIYATTAKDPYTTAIATATVLAMIGAFAGQKAQAFQVAKKNEQEAAKLAEGRIDIKGPGTAKSDSIPAMLSVGESVIPADKTRRYKPLLLAMHENNPMKFRNALIKELAGTGITLPSPAMFSEMRNKMRGEELNLQLNNNYDDLYSEMRANTAATHQLIREVKNKTYTDSKGNLIIQIGSHKKIVGKR